MQIFPTKETDRRNLAKTFAECIAICFSIFLFSIILLLFDVHPSIYIVCLISFFGGFSFLTYRLPKRNKDLAKQLLEELGSEEKITRLSAIYKLATLAFLTSLTAMCSLFFPMQFILKAWRGDEHGIIAGAQIIAALSTTYIYLLPAILYYTLSEGDRLEKLKKSAATLITVLILNFTLMPSLFDIWAYSAANLMKIRDNRIFLYAIDPKDYPITMFPEKYWSTNSKIKEFYTISGFRQFKFGNILLLCPHKYAKTELKSIYKYSKKCVSLTSEKAKPITETEEEKRLPPFQKT